MHEYILKLLLKKNQLEPILNFYLVAKTLGCYKYKLKLKIVKDKHF